MKDTIITVITVSYNAGNEIAKTIESVVNQTYSQLIDYVIMDGGSTDDTIAIVKKYYEEFRSRLFCMRYYSEKDNGVYDAMNKAIGYANGNWLIFMNAGDIFHDNKVIEDFVHEAKFNSMDIVYGDTVCAREKERVFLESGPVMKLKYKKPFCHQSVFVKKEVQQNYSFDCKYRIQADYDMFLRAFLNGKKFYRWKRTISVFCMDGMSTDPKNYPLVVSELKDLHKKNGINICNTPILIPYYLKCWKELFEISCKKR